MSDEVKPNAPEEETDWNALAEMNPTVKSMLAAGVPMTRENYLDAHFNGDVPEEWNEEAEMGLPPQLQNFQGVGLSELPAGPMPVQEGPIGQGPKVAPQGQPVANLEAKPVPSQVGRPEGEARSPLVDTPPPSGQFRQQTGTKRG